MARRRKRVVFLEPVPARAEWLSFALYASGALLVLGAVIAGS